MRTGPAFCALLAPRAQAPGDGRTEHSLLGPTRLSPPAPASTADPFTCVSCHLHIWEAWLLADSRGDGEQHLCSAFFGLPLALGTAPGTETGTDWCLQGPGRQGSTQLNAAPWSEASRRHL